MYICICMYLIVCVCVRTYLVHERKGSQPILSPASFAGDQRGLRGAAVNEDLPGKPVQTYLLSPPSLHLGRPCQLVNEEWI